MTTAVPPRPGDVFTELAPLWREQPERVSRSARRVVKVLRAGGNVLDVGCGTGAFLAAVRAEARTQGKRTGRLVGIDIASGMAARTARRRGATGVAADATASPFVDHAFDVVFASHVLHFLPDPVGAAREMFRVALPGGTIVVELMSTPGRRIPDLMAEAGLPPESLLRRYLEVPRRYDVWGFRKTLEGLGCHLDEATLGPARGDRYGFLARVARRSGTAADLELARRLERGEGRVPAPRQRVLIARLPGPRRGRMPITVTDLEGWDAPRIRALLADLPRASGYEVVVKPLRYRTRPHVQAFCEFEEKRITIQVPVPFEPFSEQVAYRAKRVRGKGLRFRWFTRTVRFERPDELIRYLYLHEYYHWWLRECLGRPSAAETACDRFALQRM